MIQHLESGTREEIVDIFHMWSDTEMVTLIFGVDLQAVLTV